MKEKQKVESIGFIVDGNRRWAVKNNLNKAEGHKEGSKVVFQTIDWAKDLEINNITFYVFSSENWKRTKEEIQNILSLFEHMFIKESGKILEKKVSIKFIGNLNKFPKFLEKKMLELEDKTKDYKTKVFFAISYGGKDEILQAVKDISQKLKSDEILELNEEKFEKYLQSANIPEPEIIIRTGGNKRLSNFLLWKSAYSELFFIDTLWPDFSKKKFEEILEKYKNSVKINRGE